MDDERIIELFFARDEGAVTAASEKYGAYCRAVALGMLGDERDAQECVNDALYRLWAAIPPARPRSLRAFLGRITRNIAINTLRDARRQKRGGGEAELALDELSRKQVVELDDERKAQMVSNLMVVLCANKDTQPVVNSGSIY